MANRYIIDSSTLGTVTDTDTIYFVRGGTEVTTNLDQSSLATGLTSVFVAREWTGNIGSPSTSFQADVDAAAGSIFRYCAGGGACWYTPSGGSDVCTLLRVIGLGTMTVNGTGTLTTFESGQGRSIIGGSITATTMRIAGGDVRLEGEAGVAPTTLEMTGGSLWTARGFSTGTIWGGNIRVDAGTNTITTFTVAGGSVSLEQSGTITTMNLVGGDALNVKIGRNITITTLNIWATVANAERFVQNPLLTISTTNWRIDTGRNF